MRLGELSACFVDGFAEHKVGFIPGFFKVVYHTVHKRFGIMHTDDVSGYYDTKGHVWNATNTL